MSYAFFASQYNQNNQYYLQPPQISYISLLIHILNTTYVCYTLLLRQLHQQSYQQMSHQLPQRYIWLSQNQCVDLLSATQNAADDIISQMRNIAETIPEYKILRAMNGVGDRLGPIILAEIGDIRRFHSGKALNSYAGNDAPPYQSGQFESRNRHISKRGSSALRKACYEVMQALKLTKPQDDPVYLFMLKKEQEGKPFNVAKMAGVNKFLRIYYARAMELYK